MIINTTEIVHARFKNCFFSTLRPLDFHRLSFLPVSAMYEIFQRRFCLEQSIRPQNCQKRRSNAVERGCAGLQVFLVSEEAGDMHRAHCLGIIPLNSAREVRQRVLQRAATSLETLTHRNGQDN